MDVSQKASSDAPILRLDSDVWALVSEFATPNSLTKLSMLSEQLSQRIKRGTRVLKLCWTAVHYITLSTVLKGISSCPKVLEVSFTAEDVLKPHWTPVDWSLLPQQLTSLTLAFSGSITNLFTPNGFNVWLPSLITLNASEQNLGKGYADRSLIRLSGLPSSLVDLRLTSKRSFRVPYLDYFTLPPGLDTLKLDMLVSLVDGEPLSAQRTKVAFPTLPSSVRELLWYSSDSPVHVELATLPRSLELFHFKTGAAILLGSFESSMVTTLTGANTDLPHLKSFLVAGLVADVPQALATIPSSATQLKFKLHGTGIASKENLQRLIPKMTFCDGRETRWIGDVLAGEIAAPMLEFLQIGTEDRLALPYAYLTGPSTPGLKMLNIIQPHSVDSVLNSSLSLSHLSHLRLPHRDYTLTSETLSLLPDSLELLYGSFSETLLAELFDLIRTKNRFPKLRELETTHELSAYTFTAAIPPQLERLSTWLKFNAQGFPDSLRDILQPSLLKRLDVRLGSIPAEAEVCVALLNALPAQLTHLELRSDVAPASNWPVIFPSTLKHIYFYGLRFVPNEKPAEPNFGPTSITSPVFPPRLQTLTMVPPNPFTDEHLPSFLSSFIVRSLGKDRVNSYFESRRHPDPELAESAVLSS